MPKLFNKMDKKKEESENKPKVICEICKKREAVTLIPRPFDDGDPIPVCAKCEEDSLDEEDE